MKHSLLFIFCGIVIFSAAIIASAHQPYLVLGDKSVVVSEPEISKAYYGEFSGKPVVFSIREDKPFTLYAGILVPAIADIPRDISGEIRRGDELIANLSATSSDDWARFYEPYGGDDYYRGPEWKGDVGPGVYTITLSRPDNLGKYILAIGEKESFTLDETLRMVGILPSLKSDFFGKPAWTAYMNRVGLYLLLAFFGVIVALFILSDIFYIIKRSLKNRFEKPKEKDYPGAFRR